MTKFIKLHQANDRKCTVMLNAANISVIQSGNADNTYVRLIGTTVDKEGKYKADYFFVLETVEQIEEMIK